MTSLANEAALTSLYTGTMDDGSSVYVETYKDWWNLDKNSTETVVPNEIILAYPSGRWYRQNQPSRQWLSNSNFYIKSTGNPENDGLTMVNPIPWAEAKRRIIIQLKRSKQSITLNILDNITDDISLNMDWNGSGSFVFVDGYYGKTPIGAPGTITAVTNVNPSTNQKWIITATGVTWSTLINKICIVTSGPNVGTTFVVFADLGSGKAHIGQPGPTGSYDFTEATVGVGDVFQAFSFPQFGNTLTSSGSGSISAHQVTIGTMGAPHTVSCYQSTLWMDTCYVSNFDIDSSGYGRITNSFVEGNIRAYHSSYIEIWNGGTTGSPIAHDYGILDFSDYTIFNNALRSGGGKGLFIVDYGFLAIYNALSPAIRVDSGFELVTYTPGTIMGENNIGPKILVENGGSVYLGSVTPTMTGTGIDCSIGGDLVTFSSLPHVNTTNLAKIEFNND